MNKVVIITLGCKQNKYESDCMARILEENGYDVTENLEVADIYIINTCAVTSEAEKKSRQYIAKINKLNDNKTNSFLHLNIRSFIFAVKDG